jgi:hypothetical protein
MLTAEVGFVSISFSVAESHSGQKKNVFIDFGTVSVGGI